jgi:lysophospholipase
MWVPMRSFVLAALSVAATTSTLAVAGCAPPGDAAVAARASLRADGDSDAYLAEMHDVVEPRCLPFVQSGRFTAGSFGDVTAGTFRGAAGRNIAWAAYSAPAERAALVLLPGFDETFAKYCELIDELRARDISVYTMDLRGQGWSDRLIADGMKGYVDSFDNFVADLETFRARVVAATPHARTFLFGHSTGGTIATLYLERHAHDFDGAILSAPMHEINTAPIPEWIAPALTESLWLAGRGSDYAPNRGPYDENARFVANNLEHGLARWVWERQLLAAHPELKLGGATVQWVHEALAGTARARANAGAIATPFLLMQARQDEIVLPGGQETVCSGANRRGAVSLCTLVRFGDAALTAQQCDEALGWYDVKTAARCAGHELLFESDGVREAVERAMWEFLGRVE